MTRTRPATPLFLAAAVLVPTDPPLSLVFLFQVCVMTQDTARNFLAGSSTKSDQEKFAL